MSFLATVVVEIIKWLLEKLGSLVKKKEQEVEKSHEIEKQAEADKKAVENAKTDQEIADATLKRARDMFGGQ